MSNLKYCLLCVLQNEITSNSLDCIIDEEIYQKIQMHLHIDVKEEIKYSNLITICSLCIKKINDFHSFYQNVHENQEKLPKILNQTKETTKITNNFVVANINTNLEEIPSSIRNTNVKLLKSKSKRRKRPVKVIKAEPIINIPAIERFHDETPTINDSIKHNFDTKPEDIKIETNDNEYNNTKSLRTSNESLSSVEISKQITNLNEIYFNDSNSDLNDNYDLDANCPDKAETNETELENGFSKIVCKNGKIVVQGNALLQQMQKFFRLTCELCPLNFSIIKSLFTNYKDVHSINGYIRCCGKQIFTRRAMSHHFASHINPEEYACEECGLLVSEPSKLIRHKQRKHISERQTFLCSLCPKVYKNISSLRLHQKEKHIEANQQQIGHECEKCGKTFNSNEILKNHIKTVHSNKTYVCDICGKNFRYKGTLSSHQKAIHEQNNIQCKICEKWLKKSTFRTHMTAIHSATTELKLNCNICNFTTNTIRNLQKHKLRNHKGVTYSCTYCDRKFKTSENLKQHLSQHTGMVTQCEFCTEEFLTKSNYYKHRKRCHFNELQQLNEQKNLEFLKYT